MCAVVKPDVEENWDWFVDVRVVSSLAVLIVSWKQSEYYTGIVH